MYSFKKLMDTPECDFLFERYPNAFLIITLIAKRTRQDNKMAFMGLSKGQAFISFYEKCGLTESNFRAAKNKLKEFGFVTFKPTRKGTIATILDTRIYDINPEQNDEQTTSREQTANNHSSNGEQTANNKITNIEQLENNGAPEDTVLKTEEQSELPQKPETGNEAIRERIRESAPELNAMFKEKVIEPLKGDLRQPFWEVFIKPLVIKSVDESENMAYLFLGKDNSYVNNHFRDRIEKKLGMAVNFVMEDSSVLSENFS